MPQPVKLSDPLFQAARDAAQDAERSIAGQIEHWARLGRAIESRLSVEEAVRLKRVEWGAPAVHEPAQIPASDDVAPLAPRRRRDASSEVETGFPPLLERQRGAIEALCGKFGVRRLAFFGSVLRSGSCAA